MHGGAVTLASEFLQMNFIPELIICTDMLDLSVFLSLTRNKSQGIPVALYFHENQLCYPWSPDDQDVSLNRDRHYAFINYTSALSADQIYFNSVFHKNQFIKDLGQFLSEFPDYKNLATIAAIEKKSEVLYLGVDLQKFDRYKNDSQNKLPVLLWNHRWEYDKNPNLFFNTLIELKNEGYKFELIVLGRSYPREPDIFKTAQTQLATEIIHWGYAESFSDYARLLWAADIVPITSNQEFFGISAVEAIYCNNVPLLPNRLCYPEHIADLKCFYNTTAEFKKSLELLIRSHGSYPKIDLNKIKSYDWSHQIIRYDDAFSVLSSNFAQNIID
ncbi:glycosyl transferase family 1 [Portibacter lacus]|uniref:tRNA-queuosine alpha-mannosyltransferase n=2 Tax=Portibacter lacus TaxID=1099794 RepID=A0AA37WEU7_9BACT|nr:glycosyl transferase family 1 [Portibacter lacus]